MDALRRNKIPNAEKYRDIDLVTDILDPIGEGETSPGSSDVGDVSGSHPQWSLAHHVMCWEPPVTVGHL